MSYANDVSDDGNTVVGSSGHTSEFIIFNGEGFRWRESTGIQGVGHGIGSEDEITSVGSNGEILAGFSRGLIQTVAFLWTENSGIRHIFAGRPLGMTPDSQYVVGEDHNYQSVIWSIHDLSLTPIGNLPGKNVARATALSDDGEWVVGYSGIFNPNNPDTFLDPSAFIWTEATGIQSLDALFASDAEIDAILDGWEITHAWDISGDGETLVGQARNADGVVQAWRASDIEMGVDIAVVDAVHASISQTDFAFHVNGSARVVDFALYRSHDSVFDANADELLASVQVSTVTNSTGTSSIALSQRVPADPDRPFLLLVADPAHAIADIDRSNNVAVVQQPDITADDFTYRVTADDSGESNGPIPVGSSFEISAKIANIGHAESGGFVIKLFASVDNTIDPIHDHFIADIASVASLAAGETVDITGTAVLPLTLPNFGPNAFVGEIYIGLVVDLDNAILEADEGNNWNQTSNLFGFGRRDKRAVQLYDPVPERNTISTDFPTRAAAEAWLQSNGFARPQGHLDSQWDRRIAGSSISRFDGGTRTNVFRSDGAVCRNRCTTPPITSGRWSVEIQGATSAFNPSMLSTIIGEPSPRSIWQNGVRWLFYVRDWHRRF